MEWALFQHRSQSHCLIEQGRNLWWHMELSRDYKGNLENFKCFLAQWKEKLEQCAVGPVEPQERRKRQQTASKLLPHFMQMRSHLDSLFIFYEQKWGKTTWLQWKKPQYLGRGSSSKHWDAISHDSKERWQEGIEGSTGQGQGSGAIAPLVMGTRQYQWHSYSPLSPLFPVNLHPKRLITSCL